MNDDTINDLKQFIATTISQQTSDLATKEDIQRIEDKIDNLSSSVAEAIEATNEVSEAVVNDHEQRIVKLEQKTA